MNWFILAVLAAFFSAVKDAISKQSLKNVDEYVVTWASRFFALPVLLPFVLINDIPTLGREFYINLFFILGIQIVANILYFRAIKLSDLSLTIPLLAFTPLFLLVTSPLIVGEYPRWIDVAGIILIVGGSYLLNIKNKKQGYLAPFRALLYNPGAKLMLLVAFCWSLLSNFNKVGVQTSSPTFWPAFNSSILAIAFFGIALSKSSKPWQQVKQNYQSLIPMGICQGLLLLFFMKALDLALVAQVISVKRLSILFAVMFGYFCFGEAGIKERLLGAGIMLIGVTLITLF